jgi:hypothetical protein
MVPEFLKTNSAILACVTYNWRDMSISLDKATLEAALVGYQQHLQQIEAKMADLRRMLKQVPAAAPAAKRARKAAPAKQKHRMSPEGRARIAAAQRARWAKVKKAQKAQKSQE